jgi:hypothetical protein
VLSGILFLASAMSHASGLKCGEWVIDANDAGETTINGAVTNTQKVTFLKARGDYANMKLEMALSPAPDGYAYGYELIKRNGKAILNVEVLRANMHQPRVFGTYDCERLK